MATELSPAVGIVWGAVGIGALLFVLQFIVIPTWVDIFRERLFAIRRELFVYMADGYIAPDHPAYTRLRSQLNGIIRFAERITFLRVVMFGGLIKPELMTRPTLEELLATVPDPAVRERLAEFHRSLGVAILEHVARSSPIAWAMAIPVGAVLLIKGLRFRDIPEKVPAVSEPMRNLEEQAAALACAA